MVKDLVKNLCVSLETDIGGVSGATSRKVVVATPVITLTDNSVTITCDTTGATIYYTLDGSTPTSGSTQYSAAFTLTQSCTIKAIAIKSGMTDSEVASENYVAIQYLTAWELVGNSAVQSDEIWSCGELGQDSKYHVYIQSNGKIFDVALDEPLRKVNSVTDTVVFSNGVAVVTRNLAQVALADMPWASTTTSTSGKYRLINPKNSIYNGYFNPTGNNVICTGYNTVTEANTYSCKTGICISTSGRLIVYDDNYSSSDSADDFLLHAVGIEAIAMLATPTTETITVPEIEQSSTDTYTQIITTGAKAVEWTSFTPNPE